MKIIEAKDERVFKPFYIVIESEEEACAMREIFGSSGSVAEALICDKDAEQRFIRVLDDTEIFQRLKGFRDFESFFERNKK